jgi:AraC-like DNA-binding protein
MIHFFFLLIVSAFKYPVLFSKLRLAGEMGREKSVSPKFVLGESQIIEWNKKLDDLMINKKLYESPELDIATLASHLEIKAYQLSSIINQSKGQKFNDYINQLRVVKVEELLKNGEHHLRTIEAIGLEAGFKSKSTFYTAFKKHTGFTPKQYLTN